MTQESFAAADAATVGFYDGLAPGYANQFADWQAASGQQAAILDKHLRPGGTVRVLDVACGIGTQAIGLAQLGYEVHASDISPASIEQAQRNADEAGVSIRLDVADFRDLSSLPDGFDAVICCDNALPHLLNDADMLAALQNMRARLRPGGILLLSIRDYDEARVERPGGQAPRVFHDRHGVERMVLQLWEWQSEDIYYLRHVMLARDGQTWQGSEHHVHYRAVARAQISALALAAGMTDPQWHMPETSGYYQPILVVHA